MLRPHPHWLPMPKAPDPPVLNCAAVAAAACAAAAAHISELVLGPPLAEPSVDALGAFESSSITSCCRRVGPTCAPEPKFMSAALMSSCAKGDARVRDSHRHRARHRG